MNSLAAGLGEALVLLVGLVFEAILTASLLLAISRNLKQNNIGERDRLTVYFQVGIALVVMPFIISFIIPKDGMVLGLVLSVLFWIGHIVLITNLCRLFLRFLIKFAVRLTNNKHFQNALIILGVPHGQRALLGKHHRIGSLAPGD